MICPNCGYENNTDDAFCCSLCGKVFRKEKIEEERGKEKFVKKPEEPESDEDFLDHDDGFWDSGCDYRDIIYALKKLRKRILHPIEICGLSVLVGGFFNIGCFFLNKCGIIPMPTTLFGKQIFFGFSFIIPVIILGEFFMKKTTKNILILSGFLISALTIAIGSTMFDIIAGYRSTPQLVPAYFLVIFLLVVFMGTIVYRFLTRRK